MNSIAPNESSGCDKVAPLILFVGAVGEVPKQIFGRNAEKKGLTECATINNLMLGKGQVTPENIVLTRQKDFFYRLVRQHKIINALGVFMTKKMFSYGLLLLTVFIPFIGYAANNKPVKTQKEVVISTNPERYKSKLEIEIDDIEKECIENNPTQGGNE